jgi:hypothetical protein
LILADAEAAMEYLKKNNAGIFFANTIPRMHLEEELDFAMRALKRLVDVDPEATIGFINAGIFPHSSQAEINYIMQSGYQLISETHFPAAPADNTWPRLLLRVSEHQRKKLQQRLTEEIPEIADKISWVQGGARTKVVVITF